MNDGVIARVATAIIVIIVVVVGGIATLNHDISYAAYFHDVALGVGLLGIGYGLDSHSKP